MTAFSSAKDPTSRTRRLDGETVRLPHPDDETARLEGSARPPPALVLDRYLLDRRLGRGAYGAVWLAFDEKLRREVAIKVIARDDEAVGERATHEARAAARLNHPGIVALYELLGDDEAIYLVSELVPGRTLAELGAAGALADRDIARIGAALCDALAHAHERGVIHRDVKPQNVMVVAEPAAGAGFAKLTDFGVAQLAGGEGTGTDSVVGTLAYMAPEQASGERASEASDVYSLAITLYEALGGDNPVRGRTPAETARRLGTRLPALRSRRRDLPPGLCEAIDDALDPDPDLRLRSPELRAAIDAAAPGLSDAGGLVEEETLERVGLTDAGRGALGPLAPAATRVADPRRPQPLREHAPGARAPELASRAAAAVAAAALFTGAAALLGPTAPVAPVAFGAATALLVGLLLRIGWIAAAIAVCVWLATPDADRIGTALVLAALLAPVPLLLPRAGKLWSVPAIAPLLGAIGLAPLFLALAGMPATVWRRAGLGAAGFAWVAGAEVLSGNALLFGTADDTLARPTWETSFTGAAQDAIYPALAGPALAPLAVWAGFAVMLPLLVRGRGLALDLLGAGIWAAGLVAAHAGLAGMLSASVERSEARGAVVGALLGGLAAVAAAAFAPPASRGAADALGPDDVP